MCFEFLNYTEAGSRDSRRRRARAASTLKLAVVTYVRFFVAATNVSLKSVVVFVQSEDYEHGSGNAFDGSVLASAGDVVVVTFNFRLGLFGK